MASITNRKGKYYVVYWFDSFDGKRKQITKSGFKTKKEAEIEGIQAYNEYNNTRTFIYSFYNFIFRLLGLLDGKLLSSKSEI